ncbi:hypothetical protein [Sphingomonas profundi]|uniref:hypothetical protein n=1 Tax=Alterirhizorhabdus profundi TaxID=2681549 RepID=UPI0018D11410|nr:hypothetical protein [Sphingomonas profundi]
MRRLMTLLLGMVLAGLAARAGVAAEPVAGGAARPTIQQLFDQAQAAAVRGDVAAAVAGYEAIERRLGEKARPATLALVRGRRGVLLNDLRRSEEAEPLLRYALANMAGDDPSLASDRIDVAMALGILDERTFDYVAALRSYRLAEAAATRPESKRAIWAAQARVTMFDDPAAALALVDKALAVPAGGDAKAAAQMDALYRNLKGRVLLNARQFAAARVELEAAVKALGGLTLQLDLADVSARSDAAIAALLAGNQEAARRYMAYTGAGTQRDVLPPPIDGDNAPLCDADAGLLPDTVGVVELSIRDDGSVGGAAPIYASRNGPAALAFARAVSGWTWKPEEAAKIKPFFRSAMRIEIRCSLATDRPSVTDLLKPAVAAWQATHPSPTLLENRVALPVGEWMALTRQAQAAALAEKAPAQVVAYLSIREASLLAFGTTGRAAWRRQVPVLAAAAARAPIAQDPQARAAVLLVQADVLMALRDYRVAQPVLEAAVAGPGLDPHDPLMVGALLRLATTKAQLGDLAAARAAYRQSGLTAQQCALVDAVPALTASNASSNDFPQEALRWGFEGWTKTEFDVTAGGRTANVRTLYAYPPFVFSPASVAIQSGARYTQSYRPEGGLGCGGSQQRLRFGLPYK